MTRFHLLAVLVVMAILAVGPVSGQNAIPDPQAPKLGARLELDCEKSSFTARLFVKNLSDKDIPVIYGAGGMGMSNVPSFHLGDLTIAPPTYLRPGRPSMRPDTKLIPAGKEILYGTYTMGYPEGFGQVNVGGFPGNTRRDQIHASISFREWKVHLTTDPKPLKIPEK